MQTSDGYLCFTFQQCVWHNPASGSGIWTASCFFSSKSPLICHSCFGQKNCSSFELASTGSDNSCSLENDIQRRWGQGTSDSCKFLRSSTSIPIFLFCYLSPCIMTDRQTESQTMQPGWVTSKNCVQKTLLCVSSMIGGFPSGSPPDGFCFTFSLWYPWPRTITISTSQF